MTDIALPPPGATPNTAGIAPAANPAGDASAERLISSDFETFLRMLTTQLENQDPLNPMESSEFAVQLATFSGVEQQVRTNELLSDLGGSLGALGFAQLGGWVGMEVLAPVPGQFSGRAILVETAPEPGAFKAELRVSDALGLVERIPLPAEGGTVEWTGTLPGGTPLPAGAYSFEVVSLDETGTVIGTQTPPIYAEVMEARPSGDGVQLILAGGHGIGADEIGAIRAGRD